MRRLREFRSMRRAGFTRDERRAFRAAFGTDAGELDCARVRLILRYYAAADDPVSLTMLATAAEHLRVLEGRDAA